MRCCPHAVGRRAPPLPRRPEDDLQTGDRALGPRVGSQASDLGVMLVRLAVARFGCPIAFRRREVPLARYRIPLTRSVMPSLCGLVADMSSPLARVPAAVVRLTSEAGGKVTVARRLVLVCGLLIPISRVLIAIGACLIAVGKGLIAIGAGLIEIRAGVIVCGLLLMGIAGPLFPGRASGRSDRRATNCVVTRLLLTRPAA